MPSLHRSPPLIQRSWTRCNPSEFALSHRNDIESRCDIPTCQAKNCLYSETVARTQNESAITTVGVRVYVRMTLLRTPHPKGAPLHQWPKAREVAPFSAGGGPVGSTVLCNAATVSIFCLFLQTGSLSQRAAQCGRHNPRRYMATKSPHGFQASATTTYFTTANLNRYRTVRFVNTAALHPDTLDPSSRSQMIIDGAFGDICVRHCIICLQSSELRYTSHTR